MTKKQRVKALTLWLHETHDANPAHKLPVGSWETRSKRYKDDLGYVALQLIDNPPACLTSARTTTSNARKR